MQTDATITGPAFSGSKEQQELAERLFSVFQARGRFFSDLTPIRLTVAQMAEFMEQQEPGADWPGLIDAALSASPDVFSREEQDDSIVFATTRAGTPGVSGNDAGRQQVLIRRFVDPEPRREPVRRPTPARQFEPTPPEPVVADEPRRTETYSRLEDLGMPEPDVQPDVVEQAPDERVEEPVVDVPSAPSIATDTLDVASASDEDLAEAVRSSLTREIAVARWGDTWMAEDRVERLSRGDLRRIEDYLKEQDAGAATDEDIVQDVFGVRPNAPEYDTRRFAINFRLSRETREFEYLGTSRLGLWSVANPPPVGTSKRKASEIGQDYRFLLDYRTPDEMIEEGLVEHILSFYEYTYGVLPLDANIASIMPEAGFPEQRAARITFESPQTNETFQAELRFPTGNRGGFIAGLETFFADNLVPGAVVTIEKTDRDDQFLLEYFRVSGEDRKLLHVDEKKGKYAFRSTTYYCATQDEWVLSENSYPKLADAKPLDDRARRRPEHVVAVTFERVGENVGDALMPRYSASFTDLLAVANIERPISAELLRDILTSGTYQEFSADDSSEDTFFYSPSGSDESES